MKTLDLFGSKEPDKEPNEVDASAPLAERMRPKTIKEYIGQSHLLTPGSLLRRSIEEDKLFS
ncbi:MAG: replication-associated recombination protein A, partial [Smithellaceae bacterium]